MNKLMLLPLAAAALTAGCATYGDGYGNRGYASADNPYGYYDRGSYDRYGNYDWDRPDPSNGGYYADSYYRNDSRYREHRLSQDERVYRGRDNRYYCRRSDGTTGLIVGGISGGILGSIIAPGDSRPLGAVLGAIAGGAAGAAIDSNSSRDNVRCR